MREVVNASAAIVTRYDYTSYQGPVKLSGSVEATFQTIGRYYHNAGSGLEMALYRAYDAELGRWLSEDPIEEQGGLNLYGYVGNRPHFLRDQLGLEIVWGDPLVEKYYLEAKAYASKAPCLKKLFNRLRTDPKKFKITVLNTRHNSHYDPEDGTIYWDLTGAILTAGGGSISPARVLAHEIDHALRHSSHPSEINRACKHGTTDKEELRVILGTETEGAARLVEDVADGQGLLAEGADGGVDVEQPVSE